MWICTRCQSANKEGHRQCVQCSAPRNARRFGAATRLDAPSLNTAPLGQARSAAQTRAGQPLTQGQTSPETGQPAAPGLGAAPGPGRMPAFSHQEPITPAKAGRSGRCTRLVAWLLTILLPILCLFLAFVQRDVVWLLVEGLLANPFQPLPGVLVTVAALLLLLCALLLSLVPGLTLLALGRLLGRGQGKLAQKDIS